jgi:hypothetical protein
MPGTSSKGRCTFCGGTFGKSGMTRHLTTCQQRPADSAPTGSASERPARIFNLIVSTRYRSPYWLHLEASSEATLDDVDALLRDTWLECCDHLSAFQLGDRRFSASSLGDWSDDESSLIELGKLLTPDQTLDYRYDFGSTTSLEIRVAGERPGRPFQPLAIVARNDPPEIPCVECDGAATMLCLECNIEAEAWLCDACASTHECGEEAIAPIPNSPRAGVCGYTGQYVP